MRIMERIIFHIDMDAFFVSVEARENPELKGKPAVVGADPRKGRGRGVVSTCSYEARKYGIRSGMPISLAYKLCPDAVYLPVNMKLYEEVSERVMKILRSHGGKFEQVGIDEAFLDMTDRTADFDEAGWKAREIRDEIREREKLTCSIGIGSNKLVAKIASDFEKPNGLTIVEPERVRGFLSPLPVRKLYGVGPKTEMALKNMKIETIGDLANYSREKLAGRFGKWGIQMHLFSNGIDESEVEEEREVKSVGREFTFQRDTNKKKKIYETLDKIAGQVFRDVKEGGFSFKTVVVKVRYSNFETHTRQETLQYPAQDTETIKKVAKSLVDYFLAGRKIRLLGIRVAGLEEKQKSLKEFKSS